MEYELVLWEDPTSDFGWKKDDEAKVIVPALVTSIGFVIAETDSHLVMAMDWHDGWNNTRGLIPLYAIKARKRIKVRGFPPKEKKRERNDDADGSAELDSKQADGDRRSIVVDCSGPIGSCGTA
ncbi:MAG: hypothetical protein ACW99U_19635 [Candidatus Thorarchaeota archaeon]|jgi:hypothetical protein